MYEISINREGVKLCAFCKYWYDPTNQNIAPKRPVHGIWEYDAKAKCTCLLKSTQTNGKDFCNKYECKL